jgi:hypothetical protein
MMADKNADCSTLFKSSGNVDGRKGSIMSMQQKNNDKNGK